MSVQGVTDFLIENSSLARDINKDVTHIQDLFINLQDKYELKDSERDALQHLYGSNYIKEKHGHYSSLLSGMWHEVEGVSHGQKPEHLFADVLNNLKGLNVKIPTSEMVSVLQKLSDNKMTEIDHQKLKKYIGLGLQIAAPVPETEAYPDNYSKSKKEPEQSIIRQLINLGQ